VRRRELMLLLGGAMTATRTLRAQQKAMPVIGYLPSGRHSPFNPFAVAFRQGLSETGYVEGQNVVIEYRQGEGRYDRLPALAAELVSRKVNVIAAFSIPSALAAKNATSTIPQGRQQHRRYAVSSRPPHSTGQSRRRRGRGVLPAHADG
jgi:putative ABC transport system substrate-binding protein